MPKLSVKTPVTIRIVSRKRRGVGMKGVGKMSTRTVVRMSNVRDTIVWLWYVKHCRSSRSDG